MSVLFTFPGQGAQRPDMLAALPEHPVVAQTLTTAAGVLGEDVHQLAAASSLVHTRAVQLCLLIAGVAQARYLQAHGVAVDGVAGFSIGAWPAAVIADVVGFEDALRLVARRGELMQSAWPEGYGMTAISGLEAAVLETVVAEVRDAGEPVYLANFNTPRQQVIAGSESAMRAVAERARSCGAGHARQLAVSVPSHCELLAIPAQQLAAQCRDVTFRRPKLTWYSVSAARVFHRPDAIRQELASNMAHPVRWFETMQLASERGVALAIEMPPGSVLTTMSREALTPGEALAAESTRVDSLRLLTERERERWR